MSVKMCLRQVESQLTCDIRQVESQLTCDISTHRLTVPVVGFIIRFNDLCAPPDSVCSNSPFSRRQTRWRQARETMLLRSGPLWISAFLRVVCGDGASPWGQMSTLPGCQYYDPSSVLQESLAIAKTTARCAQYMGALKSFESPRKRPRLLFPKFVKCFCSDRY